MGAPDSINTTFPSTTPHLNSYGLSIVSTPQDGRGVYANSPIPAGTLIEVSPVLIFHREEYTTHGQHTLLDSYTFIWRDQRKGGEKAWALALGLGSLFNHSATPNVSYIRDYATMSIRYTTSRSITPGEQLFISYGREEDLWWNKDSDRPPPVAEDEPDAWKAH
ncbi:protein methyltransferase [Clavulina sp. PMI_390]|nr:protein methyltransferase [Clavulina sp. PMI_390]